MKTQRADLPGRMRVASPCTASWEMMEGDERVRFCRQCSLHVYNLSEMTKAEAESLVAGAEGRLCARLYRRADGTVLTKDCPVGLRAVRLRISRAAGAVFASVLSLFVVASGKPRQKSKPAQNTSCPAGGDFKVEKTLNAGSFAKVTGVVTDFTCSTVAGATVSLDNRATGKRLTTRASADGEFLFPAVPPGTYTIIIDSPGFERFSRDDLQIGAGESAHVRASLDAEALMGVIDVIVEPKPPIESDNGVTIFREKAITGLPHP